MSLVSVRAEGFAYGGEAFGRLPDGRVCFFRGGVPGETAELELISEKRSFARGALRKVTEASPARIEPVCPQAVRPGGGVFCPGCSFQQVEYSVELLWKQRQLTDFITRRKLAEASAIEEPVPAPSRFGWRNRIKLSRSAGSVGFFAEDNVSIIPVAHCPLAVAAIDAAMPDCRKFSGDGEIFLRWTAKDGVIVNGGSRMVTEELGEFGSFQVPASSFFQTNPRVAELLLHGAVGVLEKVGAKRLLELYCGVGVFSLAAARMIPDLHSVGVELDAPAVDCARRNAGVQLVADRCRFAVGNAEKWRELPKGMIPDAVLVDPPRRGLSEKLIGSLKRWRIPHVIYVSCAPDTLARDLERLSETYRVAMCRLYDMFPCTAHFETLARLDLK
ncbi:MAG: class I SAM-dependent RNA methyltransferase [Lentisphaeria bacterium]|jgi:23S rRNA (uracil1939-C5)-methyltransferase|nr:class I SAM-dependent RNA methyltransferase [Lentisphaeria bacterium]